MHASFDRLQHSTWRSTWPADQPAHLASARLPSPPISYVTDCAWLCAGATSNCVHTMSKLIIIARIIIMPWHILTVRSKQYFVQSYRTRPGAYAMRIWMCRWILTTFSCSQTRYTTATSAGSYPSPFVVCLDSCSSTHRQLNSDCYTCLSLSLSPLSLSNMHSPSVAYLAIILFFVAPKCRRGLMEVDVYISCSPILGKKYLAETQ